MSPLSPAPVRIDAELYEDLANPARQNSYPKDSRGYVRIDISLRSYWHTLFDTCPQLLELSGPDGRAIFIPFMAWAREQKVSLDWTYFLWVYQWLLQSEFRDRLDEHVLLPIMTASATRWMMLDRDTDSCAIVLGSASLNGAIVGSKYNSIYNGLEQIELVEFESPLPAPDNQFGYFVMPGFEFDHFPGWRPDSAMIEIEKGFWRGYWPLLLALGAAQLTQQADILMVGRLGGGASGAYVMLTRLAVVDIVLMIAIGAVASTTVAQARRDGETTRVIGQVLGLAVLVGLCCSAFGVLFYSRAAIWLTGDGEVATLIGAGVFWYSLAAPFRFLLNTGAFVLHALGHGALVVRWKLVEVAAKAAGNFLIMEIVGLGFSGCFMCGLIIGVISSIWCMRMLSPHSTQWILFPGRSWALRFLRSTNWEAQRLISVQLALLACLALFAAPWLGKYDVSRLNSFAAGQTLMLIIFVPFMALMRFLAFRLPALREDRLPASMRTIWVHGTPVATGAAVVLLASQDWLGRLYGQHGPWWSVLIQALAISLPLRFAANVMRAILQSQGAFAAVTTADSAAFWLIATPLVAAGLYADSPLVAYLSLIIPEAACAAWLWRRLQLSRGANLANTRAWPPPSLATRGNPEV